jgi:hypothetical protein
VPLVFEPEPRVDRARSSVLHRPPPPRRVVRHRRRASAGRAALVSLPVARATFRWKERMQSSPQTRSRDAPPPAAATRRRPPPLAAGRALTASPLELAAATGRWI